MWKWKPSNSGTFLAAVWQAVSTVAGSSRQPSSLKHTKDINTLVKDEKEKLHVFDENGLYLATKKIGKNNPKVEQIQTDKKRVHL